MDKKYLEQAWDLLLNILYVGGSDLIHFLKELERYNEVFPDKPLRIDDFLGIIDENDDKDELYNDLFAALYDEYIIQTIAYIRSKYKKHGSSYYSDLFEMVIDGMESEIYSKNEHLDTALGATTRQEFEKAIQKFIRGLKKW